VGRNGFLLLVLVGKQDPKAGCPRDALQSERLGRNTLTEKENAAKAQPGSAKRLTMTLKCKRTEEQAGYTPKGVEIHKKSQRGNSWQGRGTGGGVASGSSGSMRLSLADLSRERKISKTGL